MPENRTKTEENDQSAAHGGRRRSLVWVLLEDQRITKRLNLFGNFSATRVLKNVVLMMNQHRNRKALASKLEFNGSRVIVLFLNSFAIG